MLSSSMEICLYRNKDMNSTEKHFHDYFEMFFVIDGTVVFEIEEKECLLGSEDIILLPPGVLHREIPGTGYYERIVLRLNPWYLNRLSTRKTNLASCFALAEGKHYHITFDPLTRNRIRAILYEILTETKEHEFGKDILVEAELKRLLIALNRYQSLSLFEEKSEVKNSGKNIREIMQYINQHYTDNITLDLLCEKFYISKFYLSRSFEHLTGKSVYQYIQEKRIIMAKQLILVGERPTDIYRICGYTNYSNFYRAFKKYSGMSPSQFLSNITNIRKCSPEKIKQTTVTEPYKKE